MKKLKYFLKGSIQNVYIWMKLFFSQPISYYNAKIDNLPIKIINYKLKKKNLETSKGNYNTIVVHHTGNIPHLTLNKLYNIHVIKRKFDAIGYHFIINENGQIYYSRPLKFKGAHAYPNTQKIGIAFAFNLNWEKMTDRAYDSYKKLVKVLRRRFNIPKQNIIGHVQQQIRNLTYQLDKYKLPSRLTEKRMLQIKSLDELKRIRKAEYKRLKELKASKKVLPFVRNLKACPGLNFYRYLK